jgi:peptidoglycan/LPS O-acetylase OafA/YrhL
MPTAILEPSLIEGSRPTAKATERAHHQWEWLLAGLALAFALPYLLTDLFTINRDLYYGIYALFVFGFFALWLRVAVDTPRALLTRHWRWGALLGVIFAGVTAAIVLTEKATTHPHGWRFVAAIVWRGIVYGAADGVLLSVFPILGVIAAFSARPLRERSRRALAGIGALALTVSLLFTAVYHVGYPDFRGDKLRKPLVGDLVWSAPTLATLSPIGAPLAHIGLHVSAVVHAYNTDTFLPPHTNAAR